MSGLAALLVLAGTVQANELKDAFVLASRRHQVPVVLLETIGWEATRWDPEAITLWHGYGMMDLMEGEQQPSLEVASLLLDVSPDLLIRDWRWNIQGAAAILAQAARDTHGGRLPPQDDLLAWWDATGVFARSEDLARREWYAATVYGAMNRGVGATTAWGIYTTAPVIVDFSDRLSVLPPSPATDYSGATWEAAASCNYTDMSRTGSDITHVIVHTIQGSYSGCIGWFQNCASEVSAHYVVRSSDGAITQMVREADKAWHAGSANSYSIGIEHEGYVDDPDTWYTDAMYEGSAALVADIVSRTAVTADRSHIIAHSEAPGATHTDPGSGWDWDYYMSLITGGSVDDTTDVLGVVAVDDASNSYSERIAGASVWLSSGETTTADSTGSYAFYDVPPGTYHVYADAAGYVQGECWRGAFSLPSSDDPIYCSVELVPDEDSDADTDADADTDTDADADTDTDTDTDTGADIGPGVPPPSSTVVPLDDGGCGCSTGWSVHSLLASLLVLLGLSRRRR